MPLPFEGGEVILEARMAYRNILVRATNWLGDAVMLLPALQQLRICLPQARITLLARPWVAELYAGESVCDDLISYDGSIGKRLNIAKGLRNRGFDCALLFQNAFEAAAVSFLAGIPARIGYNRDGRGWLLTNAIRVPVAGEIPKHQRFYYLELLKRAAIIKSYDLTAPIKLAGRNESALAGKERMKRLVSRETFIGVSPGAAYGGAKRWLPERFAAVAVSVAGEMRSAVVVMGSKAEYEICEDVQRRISEAGVECVNLSGKTSLRDFINTVAACQMMVTNDSGAMHIGSALGVPTVTVFGATDDEATGPTGPLARVVREPVECSPCLLRECPIDHRCMTRVDAARVSRIAMEVMHGA